MAKDANARAADAPPVYLDICRRYVGARLRTAYAYLEAEPLPQLEHELDMLMRQRERDLARKR